jgi:hypothetical protein
MGMMRDAEFDDEWLAIGGVRRGMFTHEEVVLDGVAYEVPTVKVGANVGGSWPKGDRLGLVRPTYLWDLINANAHKRLSVRSVEGDIVVVRDKADPLLVWDAVAAFAATVDEPVLIEGGGCLVQLTPMRDVVTTCYELDLVSGADGDCLSDDCIDIDDSWLQDLGAARQAWDIAWRRTETDKNNG